MPQFLFICADDRNIVAAVGKDAGLLAVVPVSSHIGNGAAAVLQATDHYLDIISTFVPQAEFFGNDGA